MQNKPNFQKAKMVVTLVITMTNNNEQRTMNYSKQTQSNPILSRAQSRDLSKQLSALGGFEKSAGFRIEISLLVFVEDNGLGWAEEPVAYSSPLNCSAEGRRNNKEHQQR